MASGNLRFEKVNTFLKFYKRSKFIYLEIEVPNINLLHSRKKEGTPTFCDSMDGTGKQYTE